MNCVGVFLFLFEDWTSSAAVASWAGSMYCPSPADVGDRADDHGGEFWKGFRTRFDARLA